MHNYQGVLVPEADHAKGKVLDGGAASLAVDGAEVLQYILEQRCDSAGMVLPKEDHEGAAGLSNNGHYHSGANPPLTVLDLEHLEKCVQDILEADGLGNVPKGANGRPAGGLLVRIEQPEGLEVDARPLLSADKLCRVVGDESHLRKSTYKRTATQCRMCECVGDKRERERGTDKEGNQPLPLVLQHPLP